MASKYPKMFYRAIYQNTQGIIYPGAIWKLFNTPEKDKVLNEYILHNYENSQTLGIIIDIEILEENDL